MELLFGLLNLDVMIIALNTFQILIMIEHYHIVLVMKALIVLVISVIMPAESMTQTKYTIRKTKHVFVKLIMLKITKENAKTNVKYKM